jgi:hypothetical protein
MTGSLARPAAAGQSPPAIPALLPSGYLAAVLLLVLAPTGDPGLADRRGGRRFGWVSRGRLAAAASATGALACSSSAPPRPPAASWAPWPPWSCPAPTLDRWRRAGGPGRDPDPWAGLAAVTVPAGIVIAAVPPAAASAVAPKRTAEGPAPSPPGRGPRPPPRRPADPLTPGGRLGCPRGRPRLVPGAALVAPWVPSRAPGRPAGADHAVGRGVRIREDDRLRTPRLPRRPRTPGVV